LNAKRRCHRVEAPGRQSHLRRYEPAWQSLEESGQPGCSPILKPWSHSAYVSTLSIHPALFSWLSPLGSIGVHPCSSVAHSVFFINRANLFHSPRTPNSICRRLSHLGFPCACQPLNARYPPGVSRPARLRNLASPAAPASCPGTARAKNQKSHEGPNPIFGQFAATAYLASILYLVETPYRSRTLPRRPQAARKADFSEGTAKTSPRTTLVQIRLLAAPERSVPLAVSTFKSNSCKGIAVSGR
jgi:hypothetical protein